MRAQDLLSRSEAAPWVLFKLDGGVDHILIDEGQDTSPAQWELIAPLEEEFFAGAGVGGGSRTMFAVGDPKQSIYAFQGADPLRFRREAETLSRRVREAKRKFAEPTLQTSFRSSPEVLQAVDATFEGCNLAPGASGEADKMVHLAAREGEGGSVEVWPLAWKVKADASEPWDAPLDVERETSAPAQLAKGVAQRVKLWIDRREGVWDNKELRPMHAGDVIALVRTRGALFHELIKAFKRAGLPVAGADRMLLKDELAVQDCLALIRVALDPGDDLSLACVLKGPWCNLDDDDCDIFPLAHGRSEGESLYARLMACGEPKYEHARAFVSELIARAGADAFDFLSWALETPDADARSGFARVFARLGGQARDPLEELLSRALAPSPYRAPSLQLFLHEIETDAGQVKREMEAAGSAIRVMTVHAAKGLEAPVVILPDCTAQVSDRAEDGLMFAQDGPFLSSSEKLDDGATAAARAAHKERAMGEHLRLLYVAMTRARDRLVVCGAQYGNATAGEADESWRLMVEQGLLKLDALKCETPFGEGLRLGQVFTATAREALLPEAVKLPDWVRKPVREQRRMEPAAPSRAEAFAPAVFSPRGDGQERFRRGRLIHGLLERLPEIAGARREQAALSWLERQGVEASEAVKLAAEALRVIDSSDFSSVFGPSSRAEIPIVGVAAGRPVAGIVDRLALVDAGVLVLDFKTDRPAPKTPLETPSAYVLQMALYRAVIGAIFPGKIVRCALLWTEAPRLMELPAEVMERELNRFGAM
jgi:ATP-dependent helicase/nuclease subunit A